LRWLKAEFPEVWLGRLTTSQFEKMYLRPRTCRLRCSVVDALAADAAAAHHVGPATWFVSHTWNNAFPDTLDSIFAFFEGRPDAAKRVQERGARYKVADELRISAPPLRACSELGIFTRSLDSRARIY
jgi:hypothetical protein